MSIKDIIRGSEMDYFGELPSSKVINALRLTLIEAIDPELAKRLKEIQIETPEEDEHFEIIIEEAPDV